MTVISSGYWKAVMVWYTLWQQGIAGDIGPIVNISPLLTCLKQERNKEMSNYKSHEKIIKDLAYDT